MKNGAQGRCRTPDTFGMHNPNVESESTGEHNCWNGERGGIRDLDLRQVLPTHSLSSDLRQGRLQERRHFVLPHRQWTESPSLTSQPTTPSNANAKHPAHHRRRLDVSLRSIPHPFLGLDDSITARRSRLGNAEVDSFIESQRYMGCT
ncbi:hypothetical protein Nepgr_019973 [Nepenthes gracilis]|uniref:Uncharacterized protein n=1 Tax=Nepenthes gracilis TaxID=150966 RepID=A0AAD3XUL0_NEPGR|nr:hypothetical protein Nepgr_019973 [Nepenthes gracilis]